MSEEQEVYTTNDEPGTKPKFAGFWMRFWAYLADLLVVFSINGILLSPLRFMNDGLPMEIGYWTAAGIAGSVIFYLYFLLMTRFYSRTLGKMIFGLKVVREDLSALNWSDLLFREVVGRFLHRVFSFTFLLYVIVGFTSQKQGVHDMIGNTRVIFDD
ncbi:RDD family protein [Virgibacillus sp. YIM 98842]|uniref:RDD family protein n=1 Tax=Virgibacillus sp. YIM 98842 TaxID=2663533 RepID=UPI0013D9243C|nr:RDD family protein [Virgibacillus sp. YIM 98842]